MNFSEVNETWPNFDNASPASSVERGTPLTFTINFVFVPVIYVIGLVGNSVCLYVLVKNVKTNEGLRYQILAVATDISGTLASVLFRLGFVWYPLAYNSGPDVLRRSPVVMGYTAYCGSPATNVCHFLALSVTLCITADRMLAFYRPFVYKLLNKRKMFRLSVAVSFAVAILVTAPDVLKYVLTFDPVDGLYYVRINLPVVNGSSYYSTFTYVRQVVRILLVFGVLTLNIFVIKKYRQLSRQSIVKSRKTSTISSSTKLDENALALFLLLHTFVLSLGQVPLAVACVPISLDPMWPVATLLGKISVDIINTLGAVQWAAAFAVYAGMSPQFRRMVVETLPLKGMRKFCADIKSSNVYSLRRISVNPAADAANSVAHIEQSSVANGRRKSFHRF